MHERESKETMRSRRRILFCTENPPVDRLEATFELKCVSEPLKCLSLAVTCGYDIVIEDFKGCEPVRHNLLFELCHELKSNVLTRGMTVIAILAWYDCPGLERLYRAGIDLVLPVLGIRDELNPAPINLLEAMDSARQPKDILAQLCPFVSYDPETGITACNAHRNRLILGGQRLTKLCCSVKHAACEFFLKQATATKPQSDIHSDQRTENRNLIPFHSDFGRSNGI
jgi:hypothetical protein